MSRLPAAFRPTPKPDSSGFTVAEIMMVLAIAGMILLIIFEAVPNLQRSGRNSQRKQDIQTILQAVSRYELNDSGKFPDDCGGLGHTACTSPGGSTPNDYFLRFSANKLTFYTDANQVVSRNQVSGSATDRGPDTNIDKVYIYNYAICKSSGGGTTYIGAGYSDVAALYAIETGTGTLASECQQL